MSQAAYENGKPVDLTPLVKRVIANNGSFMTGPGTNAYLVGHHEIAVIDPGPLDEEHVDSIVHTAGKESKIKWIFVTHSHPDHLPAAKLLQAKTGAQLSYMPQPDEMIKGFDVTQNCILKHNEQFQTREFKLRIIHTPGHAPNHLCFLLEDENLLFTGDHIMQGSTVVIIPPHGRMKDYFASLEMLKKYSVDRIAPGHGELMAHPISVIDSIINHRLGREKKIKDALKSEGRATVKQLLPKVYDDVPEFKHFVAALSLEAHLIKLEEDGVIGRNQDLWHYLLS